MQAGLQLVHTRSAVPEQARDWYLPAGQDVHALHTVGAVAVQSVDTYCSLAQEPHGLHTLSAVAVQALNSYFPAEHVVHETHGESVKYGHNVDSARYVPAAQLERGTHTLDPVALLACVW